MELVTCDAKKDRTKKRKSFVKVGEERLLAYECVRTYEKREWVSEWVSERVISLLRWHKDRELKEMS